MQKEVSSPQASHPASISIGKRSWLSRLRLGQSGDRLAASLEIYWLEMSYLQDRVSEASLDPARLGFETLFTLLKKSAAALLSDDLELGWGAFNAAQRIETRIYHELVQNNKFKELATGRFQNKAISIYTEANSKLTGWRRTAISSLLAEKDQLKTRIKLSELLESEQILSEHLGNVYRRLKIIRGQFIWLALIAILAIAGWITFQILTKPDCQGQAQVYDLDLTVSSMIFGVLGACVSGILTLANSSTSQKIPEKLLTSWVTFARPLVGAVSALAVVMFVLIGILETTGRSPGLYLAAAFSAGFSERLLIKSIESLLGKSDAAGKETKER